MVFFFFSTLGYRNKGSNQKCTFERGLLIALVITLILALVLGLVLIAFAVIITQQRMEIQALQASASVHT